MNIKKIDKKGAQGALLPFLYEVSIVVLTDFIAILLTTGIFLIQIVNTLMGRWYHWHHLKVTHWWAMIHSKIHQKSSNSPIVFMFCYIYVQKVVRSNTYLYATGCPSVSAAPGHWQCYVAVVCGVMHVAALSLWCLAFSLQDLFHYII